MKVAIVEDEEKLADILDSYLSKDGFITTRYADGKLALDGLVASLPDLVLLDLMLPGLDGLTICRELRKVSAVPVIMLTARVEEIDRLLGLEIGADDYICKPFSPREVVARVRAVLRRSMATEHTEADGRFVLDADTVSVSLDGNTITLTMVEFELLKALSSRPGVILNRSQLMVRIYPDNRIVSNRTIDSHIKKLRQKLQHHGAEEDYIHSVYGAGYKFQMPERSPPDE